MQNNERKEMIKQLKKHINCRGTDLESIAQQCDRLLMQNPHDTEIMSIYIKVLNKLGRINEAKAIYLRFMAKNSNFGVLILSFFAGFAAHIASTIFIVADGVKNLAEKYGFTEQYDTLTANNIIANLPLIIGILVVFFVYFSIMSILSKIQCSRLMCGNKYQLQNRSILEKPLNIMAEKFKQLDYQNNSNFSDRE